MENELEKKVEVDETKEEAVFQPDESVLPVVDESCAEETEHASEAKPTKFAKIKKWMASHKKIWIPTVAILLVLAIVVPVVVAGVTNTYKTPLNLAMDFVNTKEHKDPVKSMLKLLNGFSEDGFSEMFAALKKSDYFEDLAEYMQDSLESLIEGFEDEYGENYKVAYKIEDKEKLEKADLRELKKAIKEAATYLKNNALDEAEDYDSEDWEDMADTLGVSKADAKKIVKALERIYQEWKDVEVTDGYELTVTLIANGSDLDEPEEEEQIIKVYKVNGRWIAWDFVQGILSFTPGFIK